MINKIFTAIITTEKPLHTIVGGLVFSGVSSFVISWAAFLIIGIGGFLIGGDSGPPSAHYRLYFALYGLPVVLFLGFQIVFAIKVKRNKRTYLLGTFSILLAVVILSIVCVKLLGYPKKSYIYGYLVSQPFDQKPLLLPISLDRQEIKIEKFGVYEVGFCGKRRAERRDYSIDTDIKVEVLTSGKQLFTFNNNYYTALDIYDYGDKTVWAFKYLHIPASSNNSPITFVTHINGILRDSDLMICVKPTRGYVQ